MTRFSLYKVAHRRFIEGGGEYTKMEKILIELLFRIADNASQEMKEEAEKTKFKSFKPER